VLVSYLVEHNSKKSKKSKKSSKKSKGSPTTSPAPTKAPTKGPTASPSQPPTKTPTASPTISSAPTDSPTPVCEDSTERFPVNGVTQTCAWVLRGGGPGVVPWRCNAYGGAGGVACKQICQTCASCQDTTERFAVEGQTVKQKCAWVARKATDVRCALEGIKFLCPVTCGNCLP
jgi:hypothetical protein